MKNLLITTLLIFLSVVSAFSKGGEAGCPKVSVVGPAGIHVPGDAIFFRAEVVGRVVVAYEWKVSIGRITDG